MNATKKTVGRLKKEKILAIITDLDGTAVTSVLRLQAVVSVMREKFGKEIDEKALYVMAEQSGSFAFPKFADKLLEVRTEEEKKDFAQECIRNLKETLKAIPKEKAHLYVTPGFIKTMKRAKRLGIPFIACTNAEDGEIAALTAGLAEMASGQKFDKIYYNGMPVDPDNPGGAKMPGKPKPDMLLAAFGAVKKEETGEKKDRGVVVVFGDQAADENAAQAAGEYIMENGAEIVFCNMMGNSTPEIVENRRKECENEKHNRPYFYNFKPFAKILASKLECFFPVLPTKRGKLSLCANSCHI